MGWVTTRALPSPLRTKLWILCFDRLDILRTHLEPEYFEPFW